MGVTLGVIVSTSVDSKKKFINLTPRSTDGSGR